MFKVFSYIVLSAEDNVIAKIEYNVWAACVFSRLDLQFQEFWVWKQNET